MSLKTEVANAGKTGKSILDMFNQQVITRSIGYLARYFSLYDIIRYVREAATTVEELDTSLVDLKKTTTMTDSQLEDFYYTSNDIAKEMGVTTNAIIEQAAAWSRLGYNTEETSEQMATLSSQFASISPGMGTDTAQEGLVSIMKAWNIGTDDVKREIMDNINTLGKQNLPYYIVIYSKIDNYIG